MCVVQLPPCLTWLRGLFWIFSHQQQNWQTNTLLLRLQPPRTSTSRPEPQILRALWGLASDRDWSEDATICVWKVEGGAGFLLVKLKSEAHLQQHACKTKWWLTPVIIALRTLRQGTGEVEASPVQIYPELQSKDLSKTKTSKHQPPRQKQNKQKPKTTRKRKNLEYVYVRTGLVGFTMPPPQR